METTSWMEWMETGSTTLRLQACLDRRAKRPMQWIDFINFMLMNIISLSRSFLLCYWHSNNNYCLGFEWCRLQMQNNNEMPKNKLKKKYKISLCMKIHDKDQFWMVWFDTVYPVCCVFKRYFLLMMMMMWWVVSFVFSHFRYAHRYACKYTTIYLVEIVLCRRRGQLHS